MRFSGWASLVLALVLAAPVRGEWLKTYRVSTISENWTLELEVKDFDKDMPEVLQMFARSGAEITRPLSDFASSKRYRVQQVVYRLRKKVMKRLLKKLRRIGKVGNPGIIPSPRVPLDEIRKKSKKLQAEKKVNTEALAKMPAVSALVSELQAHLAEVEQAARAPRSILVNLTIRERQ